MSPAQLQKGNEIATRLKRLCRMKSTVEKEDYIQLGRSNAFYLNGDFQGDKEILTAARSAAQVEINRQIAELETEFNNL